VIRLVEVQVGQALVQVAAERGDRALLLDEPPEEGELEATFDTPDSSSAAAG
jgi:hypothetical protein